MELASSPAWMPSSVAGLLTAALMPSAAFLTRIAPAISFSIKKASGLAIVATTLAILTAFLIPLNNFFKNNPEGSVKLMGSLPT